jgi:hypothetical protein
MATESAEKDSTAEVDSLPVDPATPVGPPVDVLTAPASPANTGSAQISPDHCMEKSQERRKSSASGSDSGDPDKSLKRKLADLAASHGPENGEAAKATDDNEISKGAKDEDDNPRAKKRPTPPRSPEATDTSATKRPTPPPIPPSDSDELSKPAEHLKRPRDDADKDDNPRQAKKPSPPPETAPPKEEPPTTTPAFVRGTRILVKSNNVSLKSCFAGWIHGICIDSFAIRLG